MELRRLLRPFTSRNYRLYFSGQMVSLLATFMTQIASLWLAYRLTRSPFLLGTVAFATQIPIFICGPLVGVLADRIDRYKLLFATQAALMAQALVLAYFTLNGMLHIRGLIALSLVQGLINAVDIPVRQTLVIRMVDNREYLNSAIALHSSMFNVARLGGPALGGFLIARFGVGLCYFLSGLSYIAVLGALLALRLSPAPPPPPRRHPWLELREGMRYIADFVPLRHLIFNTAFFSFCASSTLVLMPIFATGVYHGTAQTLGLFMLASAVGAVAGALYLGGRRSVKGLDTVIVYGGGTMGVSLLLFASIHWLPLALCALAAAGMAGVLVLASSNTIIQAFVDEDKRGRITSLFVMSFTGATPFGNLAMGAAAARYGVSTTVVVSSILCLGSAVIYYLQLPRLRRASVSFIDKLKEDPSYDAEPPQ